MNHIYKKKENIYGDLNKKSNTSNRFTLKKSSKKNIKYI